MEPARLIIEMLGGEAEVAKIAQVAITAPYRWQQPKAKGGTGGMIPHWHVGKLLDHARAEGIGLTAAHFAPVVPAPTDATPPATGDAVASGEEVAA